MNRLRLLIVGLLFAALPASAAVLEVPQSGGDASGIGYISGWKCPPNDKITVVIDGGDPIPVPSGVRRGDTAGACGNDGRNGFITQINYGLLGNGFHTVAVRQNGQTFTTSTFNVTTFGTPFLTGASGSYTLLDFPTKGKTVNIDWDQGTQSFVVTGTGGGGPPTPTPKPTATPKPAAQVRYLNSVNCEGSTFVSTLRTGDRKYSWTSVTDIASEYKTVKDTFIGDFDADNGVCGPFHSPGGFSIKAGRRYVLIQSASLGAPQLTIADEGAVSAAAADDVEVAP